MTLDLSSLEAEKAGDATGTTIPLKNRDGDPYLDAAGAPLTMTVLGAYAPAVLRAKQANKRRFIKALRRGEDDADPKDEASIAIACAAVTDWHFELKGAVVPFTPENLKAVLVAGPWLLGQVTAAVETPALFSTPVSAS